MKSNQNPIRQKIARAGTVFRLVADDVAAIFPYFFGFYVLSLILSRFFPDLLSRIIFWPAFHVSVVVLGLTASVSWWNPVDYKNFLSESVNFFSAVFRSFGRAYAYIFKRVVHQLRSWRPPDYAKATIAAAILLLGYLAGANLVGYAILGFGILAVIYGLVSDRTVFLIGISFLLATVIFETAGSHDLAKNLAVCSFDLIFFAFLMIARALLLAKHRP